MTSEQWKTATPKQRAEHRAIGCGMVADHTSTLELDGRVAVDRGLITQAGEAMGFHYVRRA